MFAIQHLGGYPIVQHPQRSSDPNPARNHAQCLATGRHRTTPNALAPTSRMLKTLMDSGEKSRRGGFLIRRLQVRILPRLPISPGTYALVVAFIPRFRPWAYDVRTLRCSGRNPPGGGV